MKYSCECDKIAYDMIRQIQKITCVLLDHSGPTRPVDDMTLGICEKSRRQPWQLLQYLEVRSSRQWGRHGAPDASFAPWTSVNAPSKMSDLSRRKVRLFFISFLRFLILEILTNSGQRQFLEGQAQRCLLLLLQISKIF